MTTEEIRERIAEARVRVVSDDTIPSDWIEHVFEHVDVQQQQNGSWLVTWQSPLEPQRALIQADADQEEIDRRIVRPIERTARNWEGD